MHDDDIPSELKKRIVELEIEVAEREKDLATYRAELAQVNQRLEQLITSLNSEIEIAHVIQKRLVPTELPHIQGFEVSTKFTPSAIRGGDYYDLFEHEDPNRFSLILASSSGYAMSALLLSVLLKLTGQMEARKGAEPAQVLQDMAEELIPSSQAGDQTDLFYGVVDRRTFDLKFSMAGELYAFHQDASTSKISALETTAEALKSGNQMKFVSDSIRLNPKDRLVFCSRGAVEAPNLEGESFGVDRLLRAIKECPKGDVHKLRNEINFQISQHSSGVEQQRDITVLVLEVKDRIITLARK